jgi:hypothetical protein
MNGFTNLIADFTTCKYFDSESSLLKNKNYIKDEKTN